MFTRTGDTWTQTQKISTDDGRQSDYFGSTMALNRSIAVIGAPYGTWQSLSEVGKAYIFENNNGTFIQTQEFIAPTVQAEAQFGIAAAIAGSTVMISASQLDVGGNAKEGLVYLFRKMGDSYVLRDQIAPGDGTSYERFGFSLAYSAGTLLSGAYRAKVNGHPFQGAAYFYSAAPQ